MECSICTEEIREIDSCRTKCNHRFHLSCLTKVKNGLCPLCREVLFEVKEVIVQVPFIILQQDNNRRGCLVVTACVMLCLFFIIFPILFSKGMI